MSEQDDTGVVTLESAEVICPKCGRKFTARYVPREQNQLSFPAFCGDLNCGYEFVALCAGMAVYQ